jgi:hypothetical protein
MREREPSLRASGKALASGYVVVSFAKSIDGPGGFWRREPARLDRGKATAERRLGSAAEENRT